jgi:hypothetical protein
MTKEEEHVSRIGRKAVVNETCTTGNTNSEGNYCVLMYLYRNHVAV